ncbi:hypothetical protein E4U43_002182 [Claviceps pusilla]|uniref:DUF1308 domain-containing protein n=1 Tax=Claviceps pusilla TaxID=123648 RepID=A0A9P7SYP5_9HYPO|nr:hypothetical protein E4U43_002182 [Claviceps pusilla]
MTVSASACATRNVHCSQSADEVEVGLQRDPRQQDVLALANRTVLASQPLIQEVQDFLARLSTRVKTPATTGVPVFLRALKNSHAMAKQAVQTLSSSPSQQLSEDALRGISRRVDCCAVDVSQAATHWEILKRCHSLVAVNQAFQGSARAARREEIAKMSNLTSRQKELTHRVMKQQAKVEVHVVAGGAEWVHVRTLQPDRLARQMSDGGWAWGEHQAGDVVDQDEWGDIPLARQIKRLVAATRLNRHEYRIPRLRIVMPSIGDDNMDINVLLEQFTHLDPAVHITVEQRNGTFLQTPPPPVDDAVRNLLGDELDGLTETLNLDHSILVDLISDITHLRLDPEPWQADTTRAQIKEETQHGGLMTKMLYPLLQGRHLVCTHEAAQHFHHVLRTVGTASEKERGRLLVPFGQDSLSSPLHHKDKDKDKDKEDDMSSSREAVRARFQQLSIHHIPPSVQIPVTVMPQGWTQEAIQRDFAALSLPEVAREVLNHCDFQSAKLSVFMFGWASGHVTLSSNKEIKAQFKTLVETHRRRDDDYGPSIWRVDVTRNLLAKSAYCD